MSSRPIDEKIIKLTMDSDNFIKKAKEATRSLVNIDTSVTNINKSDTSALQKSIDAIGDKFSLMGHIAEEVKDRLAKSFVDLGVKIGNALTFKGLSDGYTEYELKLKNIQTIYNNLKDDGTTMHQISSALDELNEYADKTVYVFADMTSAIGKFTTQGLGLQDSVEAIKGLYNLAGYVGKDSAAATSAAQQLSYALSSGKMSLIQWRSLQGTVGGVPFQKALIASANAVGELNMSWEKFKETYGSMYNALNTKDSGGKNGPGTLNSALNKDVITLALKIFSGELSQADLVAKGFSDKEAKYWYDVGQSAIDASTKIRTFKKMMETIEESIGSGWAKSLEYILGDYNLAGELWTRVAEPITKVTDTISDNRNAFLKEWSKGSFNYDSLDSLEKVATLYNTLEGLTAKDNNIMTGDALYKGLALDFSQKSAINNGEDANSEIQKVIEKSLKDDKIKDLFKSFKTVDEAKKFFSENKMIWDEQYSSWIEKGYISIEKAIKEQVKNIDSMEQFKAYEKAIGKTDEDIENAVNGILNSKETIKRVVDSLIFEDDPSMYYGLLEKIDSIEKGKEVFKQLGLKWDESFEQGIDMGSIKIKDAINRMLWGQGIMTGRDSMIEGFSNIFSFLGKILGRFKNVLSKFITGDKESDWSTMIHDKLLKFYEWTTQLGSKYLPTIEKFFDKADELAIKAHNYIAGIIEVFKQFKVGGIKGVIELLKNSFEDIKNVIEGFQKGTSLEDAFEGARNAVKLDMFLNFIKGLVAAVVAFSAIRKFAKPIKEAGGVLQGFKELNIFKTIKGAITLVPDTLIKINKSIGKLGKSFETIGTGLKWIGIAMMLKSLYDIALAIQVLSTIPVGALSKGVVAIIVTAGGLLYITKYCSILKPKGAIAIGIFFKYATRAMEQIISAIVTLSKLEERDIIKAELALAGVFAIFAIYGRIMRVRKQNGDLGEIGKLAITIKASLFTKIADAIKKLAEIEPDKLWNAVGAFAVALIALAILEKMILTVVDRIKDVGSDAYQMDKTILKLEKIRNGWKVRLSYAAEFIAIGIMVSSILKALAVAVVMIAASIYALSKLDLKSMFNGVAVIGTIIGIFLIFIVILKKLGTTTDAVKQEAAKAADGEKGGNKKAAKKKFDALEQVSKDVMRISVGIAVLGVSMLIMAKALANLAKIDIAKLWNSVAVIGAIIGIYIILIAALNKLGTQVTKEGEGQDAKTIKNYVGLSDQTNNAKIISRSLIALGIGMRIMASALDALSKIDTGKLWNGVAVVGALMGIYAILVKVLSGEKISQVINNSTGHYDTDTKIVNPANGAKNAVKVAFGIILLAAGIRLLVSSMRAISNMSWEEIGKGIGSIAAILLMYGILVKVLSGESSVTKTLSNTKIKGLNTSTTNTSEESGSNPSNGAKNAIKVSIGIGILAVAMRILVKALAGLAAIPFTSLVKGLIAVAAILFMYGAFVKVLTSVKFGKSSIGGIIASAVAVLIMSKAMLTMSLALGMIANIDVEKMVYATAIIYMLMTALLIVSEVLSGSNNIASSVTMVAFAGAILLLGSALVLLSQINGTDIVKSLTTLGVALGGLILAGFLAKAASGGLVALMYAMIGLAAACAGIALLIATITYAITELANKDYDFSKIANSIVMGISSAVPLVVYLAVDMILKFCVAVVDNLGIIIRTLCVAILVIIGEVAQAIRDYFPLLVKVVLSLLEALLEAILLTIWGFIKGTFLGSFLDSLFPGMMEAGDKLIDKLCTGMQNSLDTSGTQEMLASELDGLKEELGMKGEELSAEASENGQGVAEGTAEGISEGTGAVEEAIGEMTSKMDITSLASDLGVEGGNSFMDGLLNGSDGIGGIAAGISDEAKNAMKDELGFSEIGGMDLESFLNGMTSQSIIYSPPAGESVTDDVESGLSTGESKAETQGNNLVDGFVNALKGKSNRDLVFSSGFDIGKIAINGIAAGTNSHSPSREAGKQGDYVVSGFIKNIFAGENKVFDAGKQMGTNAISAIKEAIANIDNEIDANLDYAPRITPIVDATEIERMNQMLSSNMPVYATPYYGKNNQNGSYGEGTTIDNVNVNVEIVARDGMSPEQIGEIASQKAQQVISKEVRKLVFK